MSDSEAADKNSDDEQGETKKRKRSTSKPEAEKDDASNPAKDDDGEKEEGSGADDDAVSEDENQPPKKRKERLRSGGSEITSGGSEIGDEADGEKKNGVGEKQKEKKPLLPIPDMKKKITMEDDEAPQLHRTASIFLRNLSPLITKQEVEAMCKKYPGFMRVAIADPQPEKKFFRRAWVTFKRNVNIKGICLLIILRNLA